MQVMMLLSSRKQAQAQVQYYQVFEERHWCTNARLELPIHHYTSSDNICANTNITGTLTRRCIRF